VIRDLCGPILISFGEISLFATTNWRILGPTQAPCVSHLCPARAGSGVSHLLPGIALVLAAEVPTDDSARGMVAGGLDDGLVISTPCSHTTSLQHT
jgi:hypothetical protein